MLQVDAEVVGRNFRKYIDVVLLLAPESNIYAAIQSWHKHCFHCADCNKKLDSLTHNDGPDHEIYCKCEYKLFVSPDLV